MANMESMRLLFEETIKTAAPQYPLGTIDVNGKFNRYIDPDTDNAWIGFFLGYHAAVRKALKGSAL